MDLGKWYVFIIQLHHHIADLDESDRDENYSDCVSPAVIWDSKWVGKLSVLLGSGISV